MAFAFAPSCGGLGPFAHAHFKEAYKRAQKYGRSAMATGRLGVFATWSQERALRYCLLASTYLDMRLGIAGASKGVEVQSPNLT